MKQFNYKCIVSKNGNKTYYKQVNKKWKKISNKIGQKAEKGKKKYRTNGDDNPCHGIGFSTINERYPNSTGVIRKPECDERIDDITDEKIKVGRGYCLDNKCYDRNTLMRLNPIPRTSPTTRRLIEDELTGLGIQPLQQNQQQDDDTSSTTSSIDFPRSSALDLTSHQNPLTLEEIAWLNNETTRIDEWWDINNVNNNQINHDDTSNEETTSFDGPGFLRND